MNHIKDPSIERELGAAEEVLWRLNDASPMNCMASLLVTGGFMMAHLKAACLALQQRHPHLRVNVSDDLQSPPHFVSGVSEIPIEEIALTESEEDFVARELLVAFDDPTQPLAKFFYEPLENGDVRLFFKVHHTICDGPSAGYIFRDLIRACADYNAAKSPKVESLPQRPYFRTQFPAATRGLLGFLKYFWIILRLMVDVCRTGIPKFLDVKKQVPVEDRSLIILNRTFEKEVLAKIAAQAKKQGTTVHGALYAAIVLAAAKDIGNGEPVCVGCASSVNMRHKLNPPAKDDVNYMVSVVGSPHKVSSQDDLWALARDIKTEADKALARGMDYLLMPYPYQMHAAIARRKAAKGGNVSGYLEQAHNPPCIVLTNVGKIGVGLEAGAFKIADINFYANPSVLTPFGSIALTLEDKLKWTLIGSSPVVTKAQLEQVFSDVEHYLLRAIDIKE